GLEWRGDDPEKSRQAEHTDVRQDFEIQVVRLDPFVPRLEAKLRAVEVAEIVGTDAEQRMGRDHAYRGAPQGEPPDNPRRLAVIALFDGRYDSHSRVCARVHRDQCPSVRPATLVELQHIA